MNRTTPILIVILTFITIGLIFLALMSNGGPIDVNKVCPRYSLVPLGQVPAGCYKYFGIDPTRVLVR